MALAASCREPPGPWTVVRLSTDAEFRDVYFLDAHRGWAVGGDHSLDGGLLGSTEDGGKTWSFRSGLAPSPRSWSGLHLRAIEFLDERVGCAVGDKGLILRTTDGGEHWHPVFRGSRPFHRLEDLQLLDDRLGWAVGRMGIFRTEDGGESWASWSKSSWIQNALAVHFVDESHGVVVGSTGVILRSTDGGENWERVDNPAATNGHHLVGVHFADELHGWAVGEHGRIFHTADGGMSWSLQRRGDEYLTDVHFVDATTGWAVGYVRAKGTSKVLHTSDGGATWTVDAVYSGDEAQAIDFINDPELGHRGWVVGVRSRDEPQAFLRYETAPPTVPNEG